MALLVCCPCGNPLDCDQLDLVVTLSCPRCDREMTLEAEDSEHGEYRAVLTVMKGPYWVGERFIMPVGEELRLGKSAGNWLSLESDQLADSHCRLLFSPDGCVRIEDLDTESGTWIGEARISQGRLHPQQSFIIGEYCFRLDFMAPGGEDVVSQPVPQGVVSRPLPAVKTVGVDRSLGHWFVINRYLLCRWLLMVFAWCTAVSHVCFLATREQPNRWEWYSAICAGFVILVTLLVSGRRMTLAHRYLKFVSLIALVAIGVTDIILGQPWSAIATLFLASALPIFTTMIPSRGLAIFAGVLGIVATAIMLILAIQGVLTAGGSVA